MKRLFSFIFLLFILQTSYSQGEIALQHFLQGVGSVTPGVPLYLSNTSSLVKEDRSIMLSNNFQDAKIYLHDTIAVDVMGRYNIKLDRMEYLAGKDTVRQIYPQQVQLVVLDGAIFLPMEYYKDYNIRIGWFEVVTAGEISLLKQREAYQRKTDYNPGTMKLDNYEWDSRDAYYYLPVGVGMPTYFYASKSNVLKIMSKHKKKIQDFIKENKTKIRQGDDLKMIFFKYNQLESSNK